MEAFIPSIGLTRVTQAKLSLTSCAADRSANADLPGTLLPATTTAAKAHAVDQCAPRRPTPLPGVTVTHVVWFRDDLRLHDHPALTAATGGAEGGVAGLVVEPMEPDAFWTACASDLRDSLRRIGGELYVRRARSSATDDVCAAVATFCRDARARTIHFHRAVSVAGVREEAAVCSVMREAHVECVAHWTGATRSPDELPFAVGDMPDDCDEFGRLMARVRVADALPPPDRLVGVSGVPCGDLRGQRVSGDQRVCGGERVGLQRVRDYVQGRSLVAVMAGDAGKDVGNAGAIDTKFGRLGPYLAMGCVSARWLWHEVRRNIGERSLRRFCAEFELVLRDFVRLMTLKRGVMPA